MTAESFQTVSLPYLRSRMGRICVAITGTTPQEMLERAAEAVRENTFIEFRLDYLAKPLAAMPKLKEFLSLHREVTAIATCRRKANGGKFTGTIATQMEILGKAAAAGFHLVDVELQTAGRLRAAEWKKLRAQGVAVLVSYHDYKTTKDLEKIHAQIAPLKPDFIKIVSTARRLVDNVTMMRFLESKQDDGNVVGICMGDHGIISRVLGVRAGSLFTFAAATVGEETAVGQIAARTLTETYRIEQVDAGTRVYGVAGNPVRHSLSPLMMNTAFHRETVNAVFLALQTEKIADLLMLIREVPVHGVAVTMPLKQEIMKHLDRTDALSQKIGACNTVVRSQDGKLIGYNTDVTGVVRPLEQRMDLRKAKVLLLGAGGAARAAAFGLRQRGAEVFILNRTPQTAQKLARQAEAKTIRRDQVAKTNFDVIVNATSVGMAGNKQQTILEPKELNARLVFDMVYNPLETPLLKMARAKGLAVISGAEMFVQQGAEQFQLWTGKPAPREDMWRVVTHVLRSQAGVSG
jgi:3-dehydroquinate dehydratase / shikimate dehydrogenase